MSKPGPSRQPYSSKPQLSEPEVEFNESNGINKYLKELLDPMAFAAYKLLFEQNDIPTPLLKQIKRLQDNSTFKETKPEIILMIVRSIEDTLREKGYKGSFKAVKPSSVSQSEVSDGAAAAALTPEEEFKNFLETHLEEAALTKYKESFEAGEIPNELYQQIKKYKKKSFRRFPEETNIDFIKELKVFLRTKGVTFPGDDMSALSHVAKLTEPGSWVDVVGSKLPVDTGPVLVTVLPTPGVSNVHGEQSSPPLLNRGALLWAIRNASVQTDADVGSKSEKPIEVGAVFRTSHNLDRLFSKIAFTSKEVGRITEKTVTEAEHFLPLEDFRVFANPPELKIKFQTKERTFTDSAGKVATVRQQCTFDATTGKIRLVLLGRDIRNTTFSFESEYKLDGDEIVFDPYVPSLSDEKESTSQHEFLKETRERKTGPVPIFNMWMYLNKWGDKLPAVDKLPDVDHKSSVTQLKRKLAAVTDFIQEQKRPKEIGGVPQFEIVDGKKTPVYEFHLYEPEQGNLAQVAEIIKNLPSLDQYTERMKKINKDYNDWLYGNRKLEKTIDKQDVEVVGREYHKSHVGVEAKSIIDFYISEGYLSGDVLGMIQEFKIKKKDTQEKKTHDVDYLHITENFGLYLPYNLSFMLRYNQKFAGFIPTPERLALTSENIGQFSEFVHMFRSMVFSTVSLYKKCVGSSEKTNFVFPFRRTYMNQDSMLVATSVQFDPSVEQNRDCLKIVESGSYPLLQLLRLREPLYYQLVDQYNPAAYKDDLDVCVYENNPQLQSAFKKIKEEMRAKKDKELDRRNPVEVKPSTVPPSTPPRSGLAALVEPSGPLSTGPQVTFFLDDSPSVPPSVPPRSGLAAIVEPSRPLVTFVLDDSPSVPPSVPPRSGLAALAGLSNLPDRTVRVVDLEPVESVYKPIKPVVVFTLGPDPVPSRPFAWGKVQTTESETEEKGFPTLGKLTAEQIAERQENLRKVGLGSIKTIRDAEEKREKEEFKKLQEFKKIEEEIEKQKELRKLNPKSEKLKSNDPASMNEPKEKLKAEIKHLWKRIAKLEYNDIKDRVKPQVEVEIDLPENSFRLHKHGKGDGPEMFALLRRRDQMIATRVKEELDRMEEEYYMNFPPHSEWPKLSYDDLTTHRETYDRINALFERKKADVEHRNYRPRGQIDHKKLLAAKKERLGLDNFLDEDSFVGPSDEKNDEVSFVWPSDEKNDEEDEDEDL
jgi:hypothetical protein